MYKKLTPDKNVKSVICIIGFFIGLSTFFMSIFFIRKDIDYIYSFKIFSIYIIEIVIIQLLHELIHIYTYKFNGHLNVSKISFNDFPNNLSVTLEEETTVKIMKYSMMMPVLILLIIVILIGILYKDPMQAIAIFIVISGGSSDLAVLWKLRKYSNSYKVRDLENETGCKVETIP